MCLLTMARRSSASATCAVLLVLVIVGQLGAGSAADAEGTCAADGTCGSASLPKLKLQYFSFPNVVRLILSHAGLEYEDVRIDLGSAEWPALKDELVFGQVPALVVDYGDGATSTVVQTAAIARFLGRLVGGTLYPADPVKAALVDGIVDQVQVDMMKPVDIATHQDRFGFQEVLGGHLAAGSNTTTKAIMSDTLPRYLGLFEKLLGKSSTGWFLGGEGPSIADIIFANKFEYIVSIQTWALGEGLATGLAFTERFPNAFALVKKVNELPATRSWRQREGMPV